MRISKARSFVPGFLLAAFVVSLMAGCGQFFPKSGSTPTPTPTPGSGSYFYLANATGLSVSGYSVSTTKTVGNVSGSPSGLIAGPNALAITPNGSYLYAATEGGLSIYGYLLGSGGSLSLLNNNSALVSGVAPLVMQIDPSGQWLIVVDALSAVTIYSINSSTGLLTQTGTLQLNAGSASGIIFTPDNTKMYVALGTSGVDIFTFSASSGVLNQTGTLSPKQNLNADFGVTVDPGSKYLFVTETGINAVRVLSIGTNGALTELSGSPYATGLGPNGVLVDTTGSYVYVANTTDGTISGFLLSGTGALTQISGSPFSSIGIGPVSLAEDATKTYIGVANSGGSPDLQVFTFSTTTPGALATYAATTGSTSSPLAVASPQ
jgi:6-phosphogluconolactonase